MLPPPVSDARPSAVATPNQSWLRGVLFVMCVALATVAGYAAIPVEDPKPVQSLAVNEPVVRVGEKGQNELVEVQFKLTNNYAEPVEILSVVTGCSCLVPTVSRKHVAPGQEATILLNWYTGTKRGAVSDSVWVFHTIPGNAPDAGGRMQLRIEADVVPDIRMEPGRVQFTEGQSGMARVTLSPGRMTAFTVKEVYANSPALTAKYLPELSSVEITYTPKGKLDTGAGLNVGIATDSKNEPTLRIPVVVAKP